MKRMMLLLMIVTVSVATKAQVQSDKWSNFDNKGNLLVGGSFKAKISFKTSNSAGGYDVGFSPRLGYYFFKGFAAGFDLSGQYTKAERQIVRSFGAGPFIRYHILTRLFTEVSYNYDMRGVSIYPGTPDKAITTNKFHDNVYTAAVGYIIPLHQHLTLEPRIDYAINTANNAVQSQGLGFSISLHNYFWR